MSLRIKLNSQDQAGLRHDIIAVAASLEVS